MVEVEATEANEAKTDDSQAMDNTMAEVTTAPLTTTTEGGLPVFGYPGSTFYAIHIVALVSLLISITVSCGVLIYLFNSSPVKNVFKRPIGERLVVYLALVDLAFSTSHVMDHMYMLAVVDHPPDSVCMGFAFTLQSFIMAQALVVIFIAINAFLMVVLEKKMRLGRYDWRLIAYALGTPAVIGIAGLIVPFLGPSGPWCMVDMRKSYGAIVNQLYGIAMISVFVINAICYLAVWLKVRQSSKATNASTDRQKKYHKMAKMMMLFVAVYMLQWWVFSVQAVWGMIQLPPAWIYVMAAFFCNMGGVFNFIAYTFIRRKYQSVGTSEGKAQQGGKSNLSSEPTDDRRKTRQTTSTNVPENA